MINKYVIYLFLLLLIVNCSEDKQLNQTQPSVVHPSEEQFVISELPKTNQSIIAAAKKYGPEISSTYEKAVCTEFVIQVLEKVQPLNATDKKRIRIITNQDIQQLLAANSDIPKGVYFSLIEKQIAIPIDNKNEVLEGDFVQFWTETWGHCGIVKSIDPIKNEMELYSSFPSTNGYGVQKFPIPTHSFFVRLK